MKKRISKRLDTRLALYLAVALVALVFLFVLTTLRFQQQLIQQQVQQDILNTTQSYGEGIEYMLEARMNAIEYLVEDIAEQGHELTLYSSTRRSLQALFDSFWLVDGNGNILEKWPHSLNENAIKRNFDSLAKNILNNHGNNQSVRISEPILNPMGAGKPVIQLSLAIQTNAENHGYFIGNVSLEQNSLLNRAKPVTIRESGFLALSSVTGAIIFHPMLAEPLGKIPAEQQLLIDTTLGQNKVGQVIHEHEGTLWMQAFYRIDEAGWVLAAVLPLAEAMRPLYELRWVLIQLGVIATAMLVVLVFVIVHIKLKPLRTMGEELTLVRKSERKHINLPGSVELDELAQSFNQLIKANEHQKKHSQQRQAYLDMVLTSSSVGHFMTDPKGTIEYVNDALVEITGLSRSQLLSGEMLLHGPDSNKKKMNLWFKNAIESQKESSTEYQFLCTNQKIIWLKIVLKPVFDHGICLGHVGTVTDVTSQNIELASLRSKVNLDELTGLMNRRGIEQVMTTAWNEARLYSRKLTLMALDLDHFKAVNDQHGHEKGDWVLKQVAKLLESSVRDTDWVARIGGDEFIIVLPQCPHNRAIEIAERIINNMKAINAHQKLPATTVSIGIAEMVPSDQSVLDILRRADKAAYEAKHQGRNRWAVAEAD